MKPLWEINEKGKFRWTNDGYWKIALAFILLITGISLYGMPSLPVTIIKFLASGYIIIAILEIREIVILWLRGNEVKEREIIDIYFDTAMYTKGDIIFFEGDEKGIIISGPKILINGTFKYKLKKFKQDD